MSMIVLPVHCCCTPARRLGYIQTDERMAYAGARIIIYVRVDPSFRLEPGAPAPDMPTVLRCNLEVGELTLADGQRILAVKSGHRTLEELRRLPGFTEQHPILDKNAGV